MTSQVIVSLGIPVEVRSNPRLRFPVAASVDRGERRRQERVKDGRADGAPAMRGEAMGQKNREGCEPEQGDKGGHRSITGHQIGERTLRSLATVGRRESPCGSLFENAQLLMPRRHVAVAELRMHDQALLGPPGEAVSIDCETTGFYRNF